MATEVASLANLLDVELMHDEVADRAEPGPPGAPPTSVDEETGLARAVIPQRIEEPASETPVDAADATLESEVEVETPGNGRSSIAARPTIPARRADLPDQTGSLLLRKGMTMVLDGRIRRKRGQSERPPGPEAADRFQEKIERWARGEDEDGGPATWPPTLPSSQPEPTSG
jgi:hypothetical protein